MTKNPERPIRSRAEADQYWDMPLQTQEVTMTEPDGTVIVFPAYDPLTGEWPDPIVHKPSG